MSVWFEIVGQRSALKRWEMDEVDVQRGLVFQEEFHALMLVGINSIPAIICMDGV